MPKRKVAVSLESSLVEHVDALVRRRRFPSRSAAIEAALRNQEAVDRDHAYEQMLGLLDKDEERSLAGERYTGDVFE